MVRSSVIEIINLLSVKMVLEKKERRGDSYLHSRLMFLLTVEERAVVVAAHDCVSGLRYPPPRGWCVAV